MKIYTSKDNRRNISVQLMDGVIVAFDDCGCGELEDESKLEALMARDGSISDQAFATEVEEAEEVTNTLEPIKENKDNSADIGPKDDVGSSNPPEGDKVEGEDNPPEMGEDSSNDDLAKAEENSGLDQGPTIDEVKTLSPDAAKEEEVKEVDLKFLNIKELREVCEASGKPEKEWKNLSRKKLVTYIQSNAK